jgi:hypothetical protein
MKNWPRKLILALGLMLVLASFVLYGLQVTGVLSTGGNLAPSIGSASPQYGTDRVFIEQYGVFLLLFLPGLTLLAIYGTIGINRPDNPIGIIPKFVIVLSLITNVITTLNSMAVASKAIFLSIPAFWTFLVVGALGMANFAFCLVIWNGFRKGMWWYGISAFVMFTLKFFGSVPIIPSLFELSVVGILIYLLRPIWDEME